MSRSLIFVRPSAVARGGAPPTRGSGGLRRKDSLALGLVHADVRPSLCDVAEGIDLPNEGLDIARIHQARYCLKIGRRNLRDEHARLHLIFCGLFLGGWLSDRNQDSTGFQHVVRPLLYFPTDSV